MKKYKMKWEKPKLLLLNNTEIAYGATCSGGAAPGGASPHCITGPMATGHCEMGDSASRHCRDGGAPGRDCLIGGIG